MLSVRLGCLLLAASSACAFASEHQHQHTTFMPENNLRIPIGMKVEGGLTFDQFNRAIDKVERLYAPRVNQRGGKLVILRKWENPTVNAGTYRSDSTNEWFVNLYGGYARHPSISEDGFVLVVCHELAHHVGGAPKKNPYYGNPDWSSTEGQADYFATLKCMRQVFARENNVAIMATRWVPSIVRQKCEAAFAAKWEEAICMRTTMAGLSVVNVMSSSLSLPYASFNSEDNFVTAWTLDKHPTPQCRLDTYFRGSICNKSSYEPVSQTDTAKGTCDESAGYFIGTRPHCWFKPF